MAPSHLLRTLPAPITSFPLSILANIYAKLLTVSCYYTVCYCVLPPIRCGITLLDIFVCISTGVDLGRE